MKDTVCLCRDNALCLPLGWAFNRVSCCESTVCFSPQIPVWWEPRSLQMERTHSDRTQAYIFLINTVITSLFVFKCSVSSSPENARHPVSFRINNYIWWIESSSVLQLEGFSFICNQRQDLWCSGSGGKMCLPFLSIVCLHSVFESERALIEMRMRERVYVHTIFNPEAFKYFSPAMTYVLLLLNQYFLD